MYQLVVSYPEEGARVTIAVAKGADVLDIIPELLAEHEGCEHITVFMGGARLFAVDCAGARLP